MSHAEDRPEGVLKAGAETSAELRALAQALAKASTRLASAANVQTASLAVREAIDVVSRLCGSADRLKHLSERLDTAADTAFEELEADLREAIVARGWHCDGQWPKYFVERAVEVVIAEESRSTQVGGSRVDSTSADAIIDALAPLVSALIPKRFDPAEFMTHLASAHDAVCSNAATSPIFDVYRAYVIAQQKARFWRDATAQSFVGISLDQFRARVTKALEAGCLTSRDGRALRLLPPLNPKDAIFIYQPAEHRFAFVGRIQFVGGADT